jgi:hypothetical protein
VIRVFIDQPIWSDELRFWIIDQNEFDHKRYLLQFGKHNTTLIEMKEGFESPEPTFKLGGTAGVEFLKAMAEKASERGIKLESDLKREGKLEAVSMHLDDMRRLVFNGDRKREEI